MAKALCLQTSGQDSVLPVSQERYITHTGVVSATLASQFLCTKCTAVWKVVSALCQ